MSKGTRPVRNTNPLSDDLKAQQADYLAAGGTITLVPVGQSAYTEKAPLSEAQNRRAITKDSGKYFT